MNQPAATLDTPVPDITLDQFRDTMLARGYDEVVERHWDGGTVLDTHTHPFEANALVVKGEMFLTLDGAAERRLVAGDRFQVLPGTPHSERYGDAGATYWVARKN